MSGLTDPIEEAFSVTPSDTVDLAKYTRGIYVGGGGDLRIELINGDIVTFVELVAGVIHPIRVKKVFSTSTTATDILGVY